MSAPDPTPPDTDFPAERRAELRTLLERAVNGAIDDAELHAGLQRIALDARANGIAPEKCLVALRQTWGLLPAPRHTHEFVKRETLQWRLVSQLIRAYYYEDGTG